jgi:hypothetical protein
MVPGTHVASRLERNQGMPQVIKNAHEQDHVEFPVECCEVISGQQTEVDIKTRLASDIRKQRLDPPPSIQRIFNSRKFA